MRRVLALDGGKRRFKLLLAESDFGRLRILKQELIDLPAGGPGFGRGDQDAPAGSWRDGATRPWRWSCPQHLSISQVVDLPSAPESEVEKLIAEETIKLSGVSESRIVYDFVRTGTPERNRQQFWVTLCQEGEIRERIVRLGIEREELCEVTTTANALIAAYRASRSRTPAPSWSTWAPRPRWSSSFWRGRALLPPSFQMGGDFFTRSLARPKEFFGRTAERL